MSPDGNILGLQLIAARLKNQPDHKSSFPKSYETLSKIKNMQTNLKTMSSPVD